MQEVFVYRGRDNPVTQELVAVPRPGEPDPGPPLEAALRVTLKTDNGLVLDSDDDPDALMILDDRRIRMVLGPAFAEKDEGVRGYLTVYYINTPNGIAWPGSRDEQDQPTFLFLPVPWPE